VPRMRMSLLMSISRDDCEATIRFAREWEPSTTAFGPTDVAFRSSVPAITETKLILSPTPRRWLGTSRPRARFQSNSSPCVKPTCKSTWVIDLRDGSSTRLMRGSSFRRAFSAAVLPATRNRSPPKIHARGAQAIANAKKRSTWTSCFFENRQLISDFARRARHFCAATVAWPLTSCNLLPIPVFGRILIAKYHV